MIPRLQEKYQGEIRTKLQGLDKYENIHQVEDRKDHRAHGVSPQLGKDVLEDAIKDMTTITGRKPVLNKAKGQCGEFSCGRMNTAAGSRCAPGMCRIFGSPGGRRAAAHS